jgi:hypothetical protein
MAWRRVLGRLPSRRQSAIGFQEPFFGTYLISMQSLVMWKQSNGVSNISMRGVKPCFNHEAVMRMPHEVGTNSAVAGNCALAERAKLLSGALLP